MSNHYFASDGNYGDAEGLVVIDTTSWTADEWDIIENTPDDRRAAVASSFSDLSSDQLPLF